MNQDIVEMTKEDILSMTTEFLQDKKKPNLYYVILNNQYLELEMLIWIIDNKPCLQIPQCKKIINGIKINKNIYDIDSNLYEELKYKILEDFNIYIENKNKTKERSR